MIIRKIKGFTLIELLIVIAIITILAGVVLIAVNPGEQMKRARNAERYAEVNATLNALSQYQVGDPTASFPSCVTTTVACIASTTVPATCFNPGVAAGSDACNLGPDLTPTYIADLPVDPNTDYSLATDTCYNVVVTAAGRVTVSAGCAEGVSISFTR